MKLGKIVLLVVVVLVSIPVLSQEVTPIPQDQISGMEQQARVIATVNGEDIYFSELEQKLGIQQMNMELWQTNPGFVNFLNSSDAGQEFLHEYRRYRLDDVIDEILLKQKAKAAGIELSAEEQEQFFAEQMQMMQNQGMSDDEILNLINQQLPDLNLETMDDLKDFFMKEFGDQMVLQKYIENTVIPDIEVTEEEAEEIFNQDPTRFTQSGIQADVSFSEISDQVISIIEKDKFETFLVNEREEAEIEINL
ncbi:MAG: SurA N-terminal domain-containing protein [Bacillota bacterium]